MVPGPRAHPALLAPLGAPATARAGWPSADRFLAGWDAFDRLAPPAARDLLAELSADPAPLLAALAELPPTGLHGDLKLANVALMPDGRIGLIDWQLTTLAPVAVELGWFLVANVAQLAEGPDAILERYRAALTRAAGEPLTIGPAGWPPEPVERPGPPLERLERTPTRRAARPRSLATGTPRPTWRSSSGCSSAAGARASTQRTGSPCRPASRPPMTWPGGRDRAVEAARRRL